jgi:hypothetical protein
LQRRPCLHDARAIVSIREKIGNEAGAQPCISAKQRRPIWARSIARVNSLSATETAVPRARSSQKKAVPFAPRERKRHYFITPNGTSL